MKKRLSCFLLSIVMLISLMAGVVYADDNDPQAPAWKTALEDDLEVHMVCVSEISDDDTTHVAEFNLPLKDFTYSVGQTPTAITEENIPAELEPGQLPAWRYTVTVTDVQDHLPQGKGVKDATRTTYELSVYVDSTGNRIEMTETPYEVACRFDISWDGNGGTVDSTGATGTNAVYGTEITPPADPTKAEDEGYTYTFDGWYTAAEGGERVTFGPSLTVTENVSYYAHWKAEAKQFTITYNLNKPNGAQTSQQVSYGDAILVPTKPGSYRDDYYEYTFDGWYTDPVAGEPVNFGSDTVKGNVTFYAHWKAETYGNNIVTKSIPVTIVVKHDGSEMPGETIFTLKPEYPVSETRPASYWDDLTFTASFTTNGDGIYKGKMVFSGPSRVLRTLVKNGVVVKQVPGTDSRWTYSDASYFILDDQGTFDTKPGDMVWATVPYFIFHSDDAEAIDKKIYSRSLQSATFENVYHGNTPIVPPENDTPQPNNTGVNPQPSGTQTSPAQGMPLTGDNTSIWLLLIMLGVSGAILVLAARKKQH
ncbi:MAG: InlB B-repeat-containing protein [Lachnospiraceae bacterium]|nr:InlB B-repeat-containing protein [Lachnospiraceae bacterium]